MTSAADLARESTRHCDEVERMLAGLRNGADATARRAIDQTPLLALAPDAVKAQLAADLAASLRDTVDYGQAVTGQLRVMIVGPGDPWQLRDVADELSVSVAEQTASVRAAMQDQVAGLEAIRTQNWDSHARENYEAAYLAQVEHLDQIDRACADLQAALRWTADSIEAYWWTILGALLALVGAVIGLITAGSSLVITLLAFGSTLGGIVVSLMSNLGSSFTGLAGHQGALDAVSGLTWPTSPFST